MLPKTRAVRLFGLGTGVPLALWLVASCHDEPAGPPVGTGGEAGLAGAGGVAETGSEYDPEALDFLRRYTAAICLMYQPCCLAEGRGYDGIACTRALYEASLNQEATVFDPDAAEFCLAALADARARDPQRCSHVATFEEATLRADCAAALAPAPRQGRRLGERCNIASDCASSAGERIDCFEERCLRHLSGSLGDGPCLPSSALSEGQGMQVFDCEARDGLFCHLTEDVCRAPLPIGDACPYMGTCQAGAECMLGKCTRLPELGEACLNTIPGFCATGSACDQEIRVCGPALPRGGTCRSSGECESLSCVNHACSEPDFVSKLSCTGG